MQEEKNIDQPASLEYEAICKIVGHLYLDSFRRTQTMESHTESIIEHLRSQNSTLIKEVQELENELEDRAIKEKNRLDEDHAYNEI